ncbi:MAG: hypothetical protein QXM89_04665 [Candidatus Bathyarchaeia archaeon]
MMPQKVVCSNCKHMLYCGDELVNPEEILSKYNRICPNCNKPLKLSPERVEVKRIQNDGFSE